MRVLSVNNVRGTQTSSKINRESTVKYDVMPKYALKNDIVSFKGCGAAAAGFFGTILGGAAAIFAAPVALVVGAAALGAVGGAAMAEDDAPLDDLERYKYTHEY